jgi:DNA-binding transcriptional regulator PaaX
MATKGVIKKSLSYYLLLSLEKSIDGFVRIEDMYRHGQNYAQSTYLPKSQLAQAIKRLRERGLIQQDTIDSKKVIFRLTELGQDALGLNEFDNKKWDGKWRIVIWDIPEQKRIIRNTFRRNLKKWDFRPLQKSVWVSKRDIYDKLKSYIKELGIEKWVTVLEADKLSNNIM